MFLHIQAAGDAVVPFVTHGRPGIRGRAVVAIVEWKHGGATRAERFYKFMAPPTLHWQL